MKRFFEIIIAFLMLVPISADAQSVGVVMSGGGAKGLYHIGVLRALEENGIPIDYISGTSMGSIVGGLYASGYTIEEMEEVALSGDLARWVSGSIDPKYSYFFIDRERITSMIRVSVGVEGNDMSQRPKVLLPGAMMNTAEIDLALNSFFTQASTGAQGDFDKLMIPFRCIGTDIQQHIHQLLLVNRNCEIQISNTSIVLVFLSAILLIYIIANISFRLISTTV